ncbi:MAG: VanZ family protein [Clostridia bacterium]|nr:VanZ family protein [Clostridia bacterium]
MGRVSVNNMKKKALLSASIILVVIFVSMSFLFSNQNGTVSNSITKTIKDEIIRTFFPDYEGTYLKIVRKGDKIFSYGSADNKKWLLISQPVHIPLNNTVYIGMAVISPDPNLLSSAIFDKITIDNSKEIQDLSFWKQADIGKAKLQGSTEYVENKYIINSSGVDACSGFRYLYKEVYGDFSISARINYSSKANSRIKSGIMVRNKLDLSDKFSDLMITPSDVFVFHWRNDNKVNSVLKTKIALGIDYNYKLRKVLHFSSFLVLAFLIFIALSFFKLKIKLKMLLTLLLCVILAIFDELHQLYIPGRSSQFTDVLIDTAGAVLGTVIISIGNALRKRKI